MPEPDAEAIIDALDPTPAAEALPVSRRAVLAALAFPAYTTPLVVGITVVAPPLALGYAAVTLEKSGRRTP